jgi:hypothetical protein
VLTYLSFLSFLLSLPLFSGWFFGENLSAGDQCHHAFWIVLGQIILVLSLNILALVIILKG